MTCVADTHSREEGSGTLTVSAIEGAQMAAMHHSHSVFIDCRADTYDCQRAPRTYDLQRTQSYFHIVFERLSKLGERGERRNSKILLPLHCRLFGDSSPCAIP